jgi:methionyl-tRNA formyltransferase
MTARPGRSSVPAVFIGTGEFGLHALRALVRTPEIELAGVVTVPSRPSGRGGLVRDSPVRSLATDLGLGTILAPQRLRRPEAIADVLSLRPELIVVADYGQIVPRALLELPFGALNLHPSLLPLRRGASPIPATILAGAASTGVTLMRMDEGLDTGPIVAVDRVDLIGTETAKELEEKLSTRAAGLLSRSLPAWLERRLEPRPQGSDATLTRPLRREDGRIDPRRAAPHLEREVRAFQPWPGSWFDTPAGRITVLRAAALSSADAPMAARGLPLGTLAADGGTLLFATGDGLLDVQEVRPAGGRRMSGSEFMRGRPAIVGVVVRVPETDRPPIEWPVG